VVYCQQGGSTPAMWMLLRRYVSIPRDADL